MKENFTTTPYISQRDPDDEFVVIEIQGRIPVKDDFHGRIQEGHFVQDTKKGELQCRSPEKDQLCVRTSGVGVDDHFCVIGKNHCEKCWNN